MDKDLFLIFRYDLATLFISNFLSLKTAPTYMRDVTCYLSMHQSTLDKEDKDFLREEIVQRLVMYFFILIVSSIITIGIVTTLESLNFKINPLITYSSLALGYLGLVSYQLIPMIIELNNGIKNITSGRLLNKKENTKYSWTGNVLADLNRQPKLIEYFFTVDAKDLQIDEKYYNQFNIDDQIDIHFSIRNGKIIKITAANEDKNSK